MAVFGSYPTRGACAVVTFATTTDALAVQAAAKGMALSGRLAPVPRQLSASCGLAWHEPGADAEQLGSALAEQHLRFEAIATL